ncbi:MAG: porin [Blastocatellia bacterium]|nr:porin [Blastocatellia bacterium]
MSSNKNQRFRVTLHLALALLILGNASPGVLAQQPTLKPVAGAVANTTDPATDPNSKKTVEISAEEFERMRYLLQHLESRVKDLETKLNEREAAAAAPVTVTQPAPSAAVAVSAPPAAGVPTAGGTLGASAPAKPSQDAQAASTPGPWAGFMKDWEFSGLVDAYYSFNFNNPRNSTDNLIFDTALRNYDVRHNQFSLSLVKLNLEKKPTADSRLGFRTDLAFGPTTEINHATEPGGLGFIRNVQQAYLSYLAPVGKGLQIDAGKFVTHSGLELIESKDNWNYSRAFIFTLGPYYHFGFKGTYPISDKVSFMAGLTNGWNNVVENNRRRTFIAQLAVKPNDKLTIVHNYTGGPEQNNNKEDYRHLFDGNIVWNATPKIGLATNYIYGWDRINNAKVHWAAIAGYARFQVTDNIAIAPRFEVFRDNDGAFFLTGTRQTLKEFTLTGEYAMKGGLLARLEYRHDRSNKKYFPFGLDEFRNNQNTLTLGLVYSFSTKNK